MEFGEIIFAHDRGVGPELVGWYVYADGTLYITNLPWGEEEARKIIGTYEKRPDLRNVVHAVVDDFGVTNYNLAAEEMEDDL